MPPASTIVPTEDVLTADREAEIRAGYENWAEQLKAVLDTWLPQARTRGIEADWIDLEGDLAQVVRDYGSRAEAIVVAECVHHEGERARHCLHAALFDTGNPVLIVPPGNCHSFGRVIAVAWKDDERAPKAVLSSMPLLQRAERLHSLQAAEETEVGADSPAIFREHGLEAETHVVPSHNGSTGERLLAMAQQVGADLLVMGAYAHGEWREAILAGVTPYMLAHADLLVFMQH